MPTLPTDLPVRPLRRAEYECLVDAGLLEDEKVELLDGWIVPMSPEGSPHSWFIQELTRVIARGLPDDLRVRVGHPWLASDLSVPEPDLAIVPYRPRIEHPSDALVLIEVSHSSLMRDLAVKSRIYGAAGVPEYWVVDLVNETVHVHTGPGDDGFDTIERHEFGETLHAAGVPVTIADLLPPEDTT